MSYTQYSLLAGWVNDFFSPIILKLDVLPGTWNIIPVLSVPSQPLRRPARIYVLKRLEDVSDRLIGLGIMSHAYVSVPCAAILVYGLGVASLPGQLAFKTS